MGNSTLLAIFVLLVATVALVPLAKAAGLGTVLGYLGAGVLVGPYGLRLVSDSDTIRHVSEFGVVMMLFLIGLELQPRELWRMRRSIMGLGLTQLLFTTAVIGIVLFFAGMRWQEAVIVGLALSMSSTAIAMQTVAQRAMTKTRTGRASLAILLVQDISVIPILAAIPILAIMQGAAPVDQAAASTGVDWQSAIEIVGAFALTIAAGRYLIRPIMRFVAATGLREAFTALGLGIVIGAALLMQWIGLSPALGAFMGGVLLADSEYRHELQSDLEPFKGLLLGLFFISVGMSIAFSVVVAQPLMVIALVVALVAIKIVVLFGIGTIFRMRLADRLLLALLLSQAGEFAFVVLQFAGSYGSIPARDVEMLTVVVALSMALTPFLIYAFDRLMYPLLHTKPEASPAEIDGGHKVIVLGYGRFGQIVTRLLRAQGFEMTLIDDDPSQIGLMKRFGVKVFYGDGQRLDILRAAGAEQAEMIIIAVAGGDRITLIAEMIRRQFPQLKVAARAIDRRHAQDLMALGVVVIERETFKSALQLGVKALVALGYAPHQAQRVAHAFERHDNKLLEKSFVLRNDQDAYIGFIRESSEMLDALMEADRQQTGATEPDWSSAIGDIDKEAQARSE
ncbi:MAG TPA: monovalent cation:proton antiporter-2 (CPA2) family protein [Arsenicitalea sp.]|jgi:glutathione-regulated potassium-efflux system ancillary protein KefC|nr:monovalent cation:proton antiporter-2 (CPA2) family protein [Arsenicitalea sp.]